MEAQKESSSAIICGPEYRIVQRVSLMCLRLCKVCPYYQSWIRQDKSEEKKWTKTLETKPSTALKFQFTVGFTYWGIGYIWEYWNKKPAKSVKKSRFACKGVRVMIFQIVGDVSVELWPSGAAEFICCLTNLPLFVSITGHDAILTSGHMHGKKRSAAVGWCCGDHCLTV